MVLKKYNLRARPRPLRQCTTQNRKSGKSNAVQNKKSGNRKTGKRSRKTPTKRMCRRRLHKGTQTDISMIFPTGNTSEECDFLVASYSKGQHGQCIVQKQESGDIKVMITGAERKQPDSMKNLVESMPSTSTAKPLSFSEISARVSSKRSVGSMTDEVITVRRAVAATQAVRVPKRNAAVMTEKNITHDKKVSARLPLTPSKCNKAVMTDAKYLTVGKNSNRASKRLKRNTAIASETDDDIISISDSSASDTDVPQKKDVGVMTDNYSRICLYADEETEDGILDEISAVIDLTEN